MWFCFSGRTDRVQHVVIGGNVGDPRGPVQAGATGLPAERVSFVDAACLLPRNGLPSNSQAYLRDMRDTLAASTGLQTSPVSSLGPVALFEIGPTSIAIRKGAMPPPPPGFDALVWAEALWSNSNGIATIDPDRVVTPGSTHSIDLLPGLMGIAQLVGRGAMRQTDNYDEYEIIAPIARFPDHMRGLSFVLPAGVPMPSGGDTSLCVFDPAGNVVHGEAEDCRRGPKSDAWTGAEITARTRMIDLSYTTSPDHAVVFPRGNRGEWDILLIPRIEIAR
jgi:hypothetical protein